MVGCAGAAAQGANCGAGAMGASASSVIGSLLGPTNKLSNEEKEARKNAVTSLIAGIAATATGAGQIEAENNQLALPLPPLVFPGNQKLPNGKTPGYVPTVEEEIKAADKGKPISGGDADSGLLTNFGDQVKEFGDKLTDRGMQALCQVNPLACASNVIMQSGDNTFSSASDNSGKNAGWKTGDDHYDPTAKGSDPSWSAVRARFWKNEATLPGAAEQYGAENLDRMIQGNAPQRFNADKGGMESMELSHEPIPARDGGKEFVPRWPQDHAAVDPYRRPGY